MYDLEDCSLDRNIRRKITLWHFIKCTVMEKCISVGSCVKVKVKLEVEGKVHPRTGHEGPEGCRGKTCSYTRSLTSSLDGVGGQRHAPAALPPGKTRYLFYRRLGGPQGRSGRVQKISITGPASLQRVAIPTELSWPTGIFVRCENELLHSGDV